MTSIHFPTQELNVLQLWHELNAFQTSLELSKDRPIFSFFDGPPFATGLPHYGHLLAGTIKDIVTRYAHNTGHHVERRFGWDCHGLPIEHEIDKTLNIRGREDVMAMGIDKYNSACRDIVMRYSSEWESTIKRMGRWIDFKNDYKTLNPEFMESVWWVFKQLFDKNQVYSGFRVMPFSTGCATPVANFEASQNYKDINDPSIVVTFPLVDDPTTCFLAWTTTPWTLPSNLALCVNPKFEYVKISDQESGLNYILLEKRLDSIYKDLKKAKYTVVQRYLGSDLKGTKYVPLFDYFKAEYEPRGAFQVLVDAYVSDESGTGIVHQAPGFGEDDHRVCLSAGIITERNVPCAVNDAGQLIHPISDYSGMYFKDADKPIQRDLKAQNRLFRQSTLMHSYPFCWRSDTPLMYRAVPSWFVCVANIRDKLCANNLQSHWVPQFVQEKRFQNWLANARDWNISRNRYWGTPIPLWANADMSEIVCVGSVAELQALSGVSNIHDLHRESIDHITIPSGSGGAPLRRIEEVFDCWFESGSMPYAQQHYPFENKARFEASFPANFIAEGIDQTRGWFYTLMVLSTHLFDKAPFKNLIVNGLVLASDGKKMSKRLKNYPDPNHILESYGADALRLYLINSPVVRGDNLLFKEEGVRDIVSRVLLPWHNSYKFLANQITLLKVQFDQSYIYDQDKVGHTAIMDKWVLASLQSLVGFVRVEMDAYRLYTVVPRLLQFIDQLTNMYVRYNRRRLKFDGGIDDGTAALGTLFEVLLTLAKVMAPFTPFMAEAMYQNLKTFLNPSVRTAKEEIEVQSVHFQPFPSVKEQYYDHVIERQIARMQGVIELGRVVRDRRTIGLKTPLRELVVVHKNLEYLSDLHTMVTYIQDELNIRKVTFTADEAAHHVEYKAEADYKVLGIKLRKEMPKVRNGLKQLTSMQVKAFAESGSITVEGIELSLEDIKVVRYYAGTSPDWEAASDSDVLILMDVGKDVGLEREALSREVINRIQRLRKKVHLVPTDNVDYYYSILSDRSLVATSELVMALTEHQDVLMRTLKKTVRNVANQPALANVIVQEEQDINDARFLLTLVWAE